MNLAVWSRRASSAASGVVEWFVEFSNGTIEKMARTRTFRVHAYALRTAVSRVSRWWRAARRGLSRYLADAMADRPALERALCSLRRSGHSLASAVRNVLVRRPWLKGGMAAATTLAVIYAIDQSFGHLPGLQMLYIMPIWMATRLSGPLAGFSVVIAVSWVLGSIESAELGLGPEASMTNSLLRTSALTAVMLVVSHVEYRLQAAQAKARVDDLTGVLNRSELARRTESAIEAAKRNRRNLVLVLADCDQFKRVNDTLGHAFGDYVLRVLAQRLQCAVRGVGVVGRLGGDEFVAVFEGVEYDTAWQRMKVAEDTFARRMNSFQCPTTLTFGIATLAEGRDSFDELLKIADQRMYARKRAATIACVMRPVEAGEPLVIGLQASK